MGDQAGGAGDQHDTAHAHRRDPDVDQGGARSARPVDRKTPARGLGLGVGDLLQQAHVQAEHSLLFRQRVEPGRAGVFDAVYGVAQPGDAQTRRPPGRNGVYRGRARCDGFGEEDGSVPRRPQQHAAGA